MSEGGLTTAQVGAFTVTTNTGISEADLAASLKPKSDKAASEAASELGKRGAEASAKARAAKEDEAPPAAEGADQKEQSAGRTIKPIPPKVEAKAEPEGEVKPEPGAVPERPGEEENKNKPPHNKDPYKRLLEATRKEAEAKTELARERRRSDELEARLATLEHGEHPQPKPTEDTRKREGRPKLDDFLAQHSTYEEGLEAYFDARDTYNQEQWKKDTREHTEKQSAEHALVQAVERFRTSSAKVTDQISEEVGLLRTEFQLAPGEVPTGENWLANELVFSPDAAPGLMLYLSSHLEELRRIAALRTPREVSREMAKLETRLEAATTGDGSKREEVSTAAPPVKPVTGKPYATESDEYRPGMSMDEYYKIRKKQAR